MPTPGDPPPKPRSDPTVTAVPGVPAHDHRGDQTAPAAAPRVDPEAPPFDPPSTRGDLGALGPYRVIKELGRGGMGAVYLAHDTRLNRRLALKVMLPRFAALPSARERFLREARAAAQISHDNVVTVFEADERRGVPYIAMQFLQGSSLDDYLTRKGNLAIQQVMRVARETASGLAAAHKIGLVHRDIKPGNLWLEAPRGRIKVLDFGLAKPLDSDIELTTSGAVVGTPVYMSPEQARGEQVDVRSDLFSLGAVLYRLCAGQLPFQGTSTIAILMALGTQDPKPLRTVNPAVPEAFAALIHQMLEKSPERRPQSCDEVVKRVRVMMEGAGSANTATPPLMPPGEAPAPSPSQAIHVTAVEPSGSKLPVMLTAIKPNKKSIWVIGVAAAVFVMGLGLGALYILKNLDNRAANTAAPNRAAINSSVANSAAANTTAATATPPSSANQVAFVPQTQPAPTTKLAPATAPAAPVAAPRVVAMVATPTPTLPPPSPKNDAEAPAVEDPELIAAKWVISVGGSVTPFGSTGAATSVDDLPKEAFTIKQVRLSGVPVNSDDLAHLQDLKSLRELYLDGDKEINDAALDHLTNLKDLTLLWFGGTSITDVTLGKLRRYEQLANLGLRSTPITPAGIAQLVHNPALNILYLYGKNITDAVIPTLRQLPLLEYLHVDGSSLTEAGIAQLKDIRSLRTLTLVNTSVSMPTLFDFHAALPRCAVIYDGGTIDAGSSQFGPAIADLLTSTDYQWTGIKPLAGRNINNGALYADPTLTADGLALWYAMRAVPTDSIDIYVSRRNDLKSEWQPPIKASPGVNTPAIESMPTISDDRLSMVFWRSPPFGAFETHRLTMDDPWGPAGPVVGGQGAISPFLVSNGLELFMTLKGKVHHLTRHDRDVPWGEPTVISELSDIAGPQVRWVSPDGRAIIVLNQPPRATPYFLITQRAAPDKPFSIRKTLEFPPIMRTLAYPFPVQLADGLHLFYVQNGKLQSAMRTPKHVPINPKIAK